MLTYYEGELAILGALIVDNQTFIEMDHLTEDHFTNPQTRRIFKLASKILKEEKNFDFITFAGENNPNKDSDLELLVEIAEDTSLAINVKDYIDKLHTLKIKRDVVKRTSELLKNISDYDLTQMEEEFSKINYDIQKQKISKYRDYDTIINEFEEKMFEDLENEVKFKTTFPTLDKIVDIVPGDTYIIGANTGKGKSTLAQIISIKMANQGLKGVYASLEMSAINMLRKQVSHNLRVPYEELMRNKKYRTNELNLQIRDAINYLRDKEQYIQIIDYFDVNLNDLKKYAREEKLKGKLDFLVIDQISLLQNMFTDERQRIDLNTWELRKLAKELEIPIFILTQLKVEAESEKPQLKHIALSKKIADDAGAVMLIESERIGEDEEANNTFKLHVVKNRYKGTGVIEFYKNFDVTNCAELTKGFE